MKFVNEIDSKFNIVLLCRFGSHLYGTDTPASDTDYKGIFMPTKEEIMLGKIKKTVNFDSNPSNVKNTKEDIDCELYSFHYFLELCAKGEMVAMDMLHVNDKNILIQSPVWTEISNRRSMFYTTDMKAFAGYAKKQAAKYGQKGSRIKSAETMLAHLKKYDPFVQMKLIWDKLPTDENMKHKEADEATIKTFYFCGKQIQSTAKINYVTDMVQAFLNQYGHRAKKAAMDEGVDWKAVSHACRAADQMMEIYQTGDLQFPLEGANFLRDVKLGKFKFEYVLEVLEATLARVDELSKDAPYPARVDRLRVDNFIVDTVERVVFPPKTVREYTV